MAAEVDSSAPIVLAKGYRWLRFPEPLEKEFRQDHRANAHRLVRMSVIVALITSLGFALIDHRVINAVNATPDIVRFGLQFPIILICLLATSRRFYLRWYEFAIGIGAPLFGLGTVIMASYAMPQHTALVGARLLLVAFFCYFMLGLRMRQALACNSLIMLFLVAAQLGGWLHTSIGVYLTFALLCANIIGSVGLYALEYASRTAFLERLSLEELAARDGLTRLLNRQTFELRAQTLWRTAATLHHSCAVVMIDVDYFKRYNDHYGHQAGDHCLRRIAAAVSSAIGSRHDELIARYGGEEIIALLVDRSDEEVEAIARNIVTHVYDENLPHEASIVYDKVSVSVGATLQYLPTTTSFKSLVNVADKALYLAKHQGRNRCVMLPAPTDDAFVEPCAEDCNTRPEARPLLRPETHSLTSTAAI